MSVEDDVGQLLWLGFEGTTAPEWLLSGIAAGEVGAVIVFKRNLEHQNGEVVIDQVVELNRSLHAAASGGAPLAISVDQEGGRVARIREPATVWPPMLAMDNADAALAESTGLAMGEELAAMGFDIDFAPVLDVHTNPDNPVIGDRSFSTRAEGVAELALAFADGLARAGIIGCGKHFPGHGDTDTDSHLALPRLSHDLERLRRVELVPFAAAARRGLPMLMSAHVVFEAIDPTVPATLSRKVLGELLRGELGFEGVVVSDDLDMKAIADHYGVGEAAVRAIDAGCDALLLCKDRGHQLEAHAALIDRARADGAFAARVADSARRVRSVKADRARARPMRTVIGCSAHRELASRLRATGT
ncbi:MAG: beta-N-acetylhexosaminidase [Deltaproteobacteria bacterium]|nr:beta-N-acetylhexosaminidase [Deltaproteobacteria bacterium]